MRASGVKVKVPEPATWMVWSRALALDSKLAAKMEARIFMGVNGVTVLSTNAVRP